MATIGRLPPILMFMLITFILILVRLTSIRPLTVGATMVSPSVVLLDNHITNRKIAESYGWKWENKPADQWQSYYANYLTFNSFDARLQPSFFLYTGWIATGSLNNAGAGGYYWSSAAYTNNNAYYLHFNSANVYPSFYLARYLGFSIRCLAR